MQKVLIEFVLKSLLSEEGRKKLMAIIVSLVVLLFLPIIIITAINPFSAFNEAKAANDPYIIASQNIQKQKNVSVDYNIERAVDTVLFSSTMTDEKAVESRENKYLYTKQEVQEKVLQYLHDYINYPKKLSAANIKSVQNSLNSMGYKINPIDGTVNNSTVTELKNFQNSKKINPADGTINQATWDALYNNKLESNITIQNNKVYKIVTKTYIIYVANNLNTVIDNLKKSMHLSDYQVNQINEIYQYSLLDQQASGYASAGNISPAPVVKNTQDFINQIKDAAIKTYQEYHILPSVTIAQGIIESGSGGSSLSKKYNNLFGIKSYGGWKGATVQLPTKETYNGVTVVIMGTFRVYNNWGDSIEDHGKFLQENSTYRIHGVFTASDYTGQATALQAAGYATDPNYAATLISYIKGYKLYQYDIQP